MGQPWLSAWVLCGPPYLALLLLNLFLLLLEVSEECFLQPLLHVGFVELLRNFLAQGQPHVAEQPLASGFLFLRLLLDGLGKRLEMG